MGMNLGSSDGDDDVILDVNTTPLIDVMLVLLVMLIITIPIQLHSVNLNMPTTNSASTVLWQGTAIVDDADLEAKLKVAAAMTTQPEIHLRPNKLARYAVVAKVLAATQRLGLTKLGILGGEQFAQ
jgi:biopolymer transport protein ExbD